MKTKQNVIETFEASVETQINSDKQHGWGAKDSLNVVRDILAEFASEYTAAQPEIIEAVDTAISKVINPSAFRQKLESKGMLAENQRSVKATFGKF